MLWATSLCAVIKVQNPASPAALGMIEGGAWLRAVLAHVAPGTT